jgi:hypothetical protein
VGQRVEKDGRRVTTTIGSEMDVIVNGAKKCTPNAYTWKPLSRYILGF